MKNQRSTLLYRKPSWLLVTTVFLLLSYLLNQKSTLSDPLSLRPDIGTRGLGLSGAFISSADDATSPLWNPAGLATLQQGNLIYDLSQGAVSFAYPLKPIGTFGINFLDLNSSDRFLVEHAANPIGSFELSNNQVLFSYARRFGALQLGANTGYSRAPYYGSRWAENYDIGILTELNPYLTLGMRFRDISGVTIRHENGQVLQTFNQQLALGAVLTPHPSIRWHNRLDMNAPRFGTSLEIGNETVAVRVGSAFSFGSTATPHSWSAGFSLEQLGKQLHYTYLNHGDLAHKHLVSIGISFGGNGTSTPSHKLHIDTKEQKTELQKQASKLTHAAAEKDLANVGPTEDYGTSKLTHAAAESPQQIAEKYDIEVPLMLAIIHAESNFHTLAVSKNGAGGLMQMMPDTARDLGLKVPQYQDKRKPNLDANIDERFHPHKNLHAGLKYFSSLLRKYDSNRTLALGAYNVGPGRVAKNEPLLSSGQKYADKVMNRYRYYHDNATRMNIALKQLEAALAVNP